MRTLNIKTLSIQHVTASDVTDKPGTYRSPESQVTFPSFCFLLSLLGSGHVFYCITLSSASPLHLQGDQTPQHYNHLAGMG